MGKRLGKWMEKWGYALMCVLCGAVVLCSALWTRSAQQEEMLLKNASQSMDERLSDVQFADAAAEQKSVCRPCEGSVVRPYSESVALFSQTGVWRTHRAVDLDAPAGAEVRALWAGTVEMAGDGQVVLSHGDRQTLYRGLMEIHCAAGQSLRAGEIIGMAGASVPFEGQGHVCISVLDAQGVPVDPEPLLPQMLSE